MKAYKDRLMTEFEKWWDENICEVVGDSGCISCDTCKRIHATIWRAALEWIQRELQRAREGNDVRYDLGLYDMLKKELGEPFVTKHTEFIMKVDEELNTKT